MFVEQNWKSVSKLKIVQILIVKINVWSLFHFHEWFFHERFENWLWNLKFTIFCLNDDQLNLHLKHTFFVLLFLKTNFFLYCIRRFFISNKFVRDFFLKKNCVILNFNNIRKFSRKRFRRSILLILQRSQLLFFKIV